MTKVATPNYSPEQEAAISNFVGTGPNGALCLADATVLAGVTGKNVKSIVAKIGKMGLTYAKKQPVRKDGSTVESKAKLVEQIAALSGATFTALDKAARADLVALRDVLAA